LFRFFGTLDDRGYLKYFGISVGAFVASVVAFPLLMAAIAGASACRGGGGACGALGVVVAMAYKPLATMAFIGSLIGPALRRARDAGLPAATGLMVPLLFAADYAFLTFSGAPWGFAFASGALFGSFPKFALLGLACALALGLLPGNPDNHGRRAMPQWIAFGLGAFIAPFALLHTALASAPGLAMLLFPIRHALWAGQTLLPYAMAVFVASLVWVLWSAHTAPAPTPRERTDATPSVQQTASGGGPTLATVPRWPVAALALMLTAFAFVTGTWSLGPLLVLAALVSVTSIILPTFLLYFVPLWLALAATVLRRPALLGLAAVTMLPYVHWGYSHWDAYRARAEERAEIARIRTTVVADIPSTIVFESRNTTGIRGARMIPGIERVISKGAYSDQLMQFDAPKSTRGSSGPVAVSGLPSRYLLLKVGQKSAFAKKQVYAAGGGPFELRMIDGSRDDLVSVSYRAFKPSPTWVPLLSTQGWFRGANSATTGQIDEAVRAFLEAALTPKLAAQQATLMRP
jgi:hypothetical protein